jgi:hypothetical protein
MQEKSIGDTSPPGENCILNFGKDQWKSEFSHLEAAKSGVTGAPRTVPDRGNSARQLDPQHEAAALRAVKACLICNALAHPPEIEIAATSLELGYS